MLRALALLLAFLAPATQVSSNLEGTQISVTRQAGLAVEITCDIKQSSGIIHWYRYQEGTAPQRLLYYQFSSSKFVVDSGFSSQKYYASKDTGGTCKLLIKSLQERDSGVYCCAVWERHSDSYLLYPAQKILLVVAKSSLDTQERPAPASLPALISLCSEHERPCAQRPTSTLTAHWPVPSFSESWHILKDPPLISRP
uniref:Ig-like domain-containing protein n=1 Tax=Equus caballus TaxID=9796 RepID=A0A5F5PSM1_HORSE